MTSGFLELALIVCLATVLGYVAKVFRQPTVLAYLATGAILALARVFSVIDFDFFRIFSDLGIMFLLFLVGLEINYSSLRMVGKTSLFVGLGQIFFTSIIGFFIAYFFGFGVLPSVYIAVALTFSSTIIIVKLLSDKRDLNSLYGKISVGFLLVQDVVAILMLVILSSFQAGETPNYWSVLFTLIKGVGLFALMFALGRSVFPGIFARIARSQEMLFLVSLAWMFALAVFVTKIGFSVEIAGFLAGIALANSAEHFQIAAKVRPLRDFFLLIFFVVLGSSVTTIDLASIWVPVAILSLFVLIGNPLIVMVIMGLLGYRKRTSFLAGVTVAQISEFSLILMALGLEVGHVGAELVALVTAVGVVTITLSSYMIIHGNQLYSAFKGMLSVFERNHVIENNLPKDKFDKPIIIIGYHRTGQGIARELPKKDVLVIDFDPEMALKLRDHGYDHIFGDMVDGEVFEKANLVKARLVISTSPDLEDNLSLLMSLRRLKRKPKVITRAETDEEARILYKHGANYVLVPHVSSGRYLGKLISDDPSLKKLRKLSRVSA